MQVFIRSTPPGEAPENVRAAWVGLTLPVYGEQAVDLPTAGVVTGPRGWITSLIYFFLLRRGQRVRGFLVPAAIAFQRLGQQSPSALAWWQQNTPHLMKAGALLMFHEEACDVEPTDVTSPGG
jgi:hypothetical protein